MSFDSWVCGNRSNILLGVFPIPGEKKDLSWVIFLKRTNLINKIKQPPSTPKFLTLKMTSDTKKY